MPNISQNEQRPRQLKAKKILFVITQTKWGGAQKYVLELAAHFQKNNEVHIAFGETKDINPKFLEICRQLNVQTIALPSLVRHIDLIKDFAATLDLAKMLGKNNYDLVHLNSSKAGAIGSLAALFYTLNPMNRRLRVVYTAHGFVFNEPGPKLQKFLYKTSEGFSTALQSIVITVSDFDRQSAIDFNVVPAHKMVTIHNGVDPKAYNFLNKEKALAELKLSADKKYFGSIASFYTVKGYNYLVEAIRQLRDNKSSLTASHRWVFIGDGPELEIIKKQIAENKLQDLITIIPPQNEDWKYLRAFDYFILPSVKEGLPYVLLEAALAKVPTIASKVGGIPEIISDGKTGLLATVANPLALASAMRKLAKNKKLADTLASENYKNILSNFNLADTLRKTEEIYCKLF